MLQHLIEMKKRIEHDIEEDLSEVEIAYLESITSINDVAKFDHGDQKLMSLAHDVAASFGLFEIDAMVATGEIPANHGQVIKLSYHDGEYLSGYTLYGQEGKLMEEIGLAKYVDGWGYYIKDDVAKKLGTEFQYHTAWELAQPAIIAKQQWAQMKKDRIAGVFAEAKRTGRQIVLNSYTAECNDPREECDLDTVTVYAMPDGSKKTVRSHTW